MTQHDLENKTEYNDGTAKITWGIDIHYPEPINEKRFGEAFRSFAYHRDIPFACSVPYRCLYAKHVNNLFIGGRIVSASHIAFSAIRVMRTPGMLGEVAGIAAYMCTKHDCLPRDIYEKHIDELKEELKRGVPVPAAFACGGIGDGEDYHFKDIGWWYLKGGMHRDDSYKKTVPNAAETEKFDYCVKRLGINNKYPMPEKWK